MITVHSTRAVVVLVVLGTWKRTATYVDLAEDWKVVLFNTFHYSE